MKKFDISNIIISKIHDVYSYTLPEDEEGADALFDPDRVPRFWKRYLRGEHASDNDDPESLAEEPAEEEKTDE